MGAEGVYYFFGQVEDLQDPLQIGRARIRVFGEHEGLDTEELPWAMPLLPITSASAQQVGISPTGLGIGTHVMGIYLDGKEKQKLLMLGTIANIPDLDPEKSDVSKLARGQNIIEKNRLGPEPKSAYAAEYPYNKVQQTESGHVLELDDTPGHERMHIYHRTGTYVEINEKGQRVDKTVGDYIEVVKGDKKTYVKGSIDFEGKDDVKINIDGKVTITSTGIVDVTCVDVIVNEKPYSTLLSMS